MAPLRRSEHERRAPTQYSMLADEEFASSVSSTYADVDDFSLALSALVEEVSGSSDDPRSYEEAMNSAEAAQWSAAIENEFASLRQHNVFTLAPALPPRSRGTWFEVDLS